MAEIKVICSNIASTRRTLVRIANAINRGELDDLQRARLLLDAVKATLHALELEGQAKLQARMDIIETRLTGAGR